MDVRGKLEQQEHCGQYQQQQPHHHHPANENKPQKKLLFRHEISRLTCRSAFGCPSMTCKILHLKIKGINHLDLIEEKRTVSLFSRQGEFSEAIESLLLMFKNCFYGIAFSSDKQAQAKPKPQNANEGPGQDSYLTDFHHSNKYKSQPLHGLIRPKNSKRKSANCIQKGIIF